MNTSDGSARTALTASAATPLLFSLVKGWPVRDPFGLAVWKLRFQVPRQIEANVPVQLLRVQGVAPGHLMSLRISRDGLQIFAMEATYDLVGRAVSAGEILMCLYGEDQPGGVRVSAAEFDQPVDAQQAEVELCVRCAEAALIERITVSATVGKSPHQS